jgi:pilus assembly protein CpaE
MYPFGAIIVGGSEAEMATIRREVSNLSVIVEYEFADIEKAISQRTLLADRPCFFLVKVNSGANMDQLARLNQFFMGKPIVALLNGDSDLAAVLHIQRAGAAQVLLLPFHPEDFLAALDTVARQFGCPITSSKVIAILGASEGCGATSLAINLSDAIASVRNMSCILIELSLRLGRLASYLAIEPTVTASDLLAGQNAMDGSLVKRALVPVTDNFHVLAGPHRSLDCRVFDPARAGQLIGCARRMVEVVILDLPYTFDELYFEALSTADLVVLVARQSPPSLQALKVVSEAVAQRVLGARQYLVINGYGPQTEDFTEEQLCATFAVGRIWTIPHDPVAFKAAENSGRPLHRQSPQSRAWPAIAALASELTGLDQPVAPQRKPAWLSWLLDRFKRAPPAGDSPLPVPPTTEPLSV